MDGREERNGRTDNSNAGQPIGIEGKLRSILAISKIVVDIEAVEQIVGIAGFNELAEATGVETESNANLNACFAAKYR